MQLGNQQNEHLRHSTRRAQRHAEDTGWPAVTDDKTSCKASILATKKLRYEVTIGLAKPIRPQLPTVVKSISPLTNRYNGIIHITVGSWGHRNVLGGPPTM